MQTYSKDNQVSDTAKACMECGAYKFVIMLAWPFKLVSNGVPS